MIFFLFFFFQQKPAYEMSERDWSSDVCSSDLCEYCYANTSKQAAATNYKCHKDNPMGETITGK